MAVAVAAVAVAVAAGYVQHEASFGRYGLIPQPQRQLAKLYEYLTDAAFPRSLTQALLPLECWHFPSSAAVGCLLSRTIRHLHNLSLPVSIESAHTAHAAIECAAFLFCFAI